MFLSLCLSCLTFFRCHLRRFTVGLFVKRHVSEINHKIQKYDCKIQQISNQYIADLMRYDLRSYSGNITGDYEQYKSKTCAVGCFRFVSLNEIERPRKAKANKHNCFQYRTHSWISFILTIWYHTSPAKTIIWKKQTLFLLTCHLFYFQKPFK